jgi:hypothetical protein
MINYNKIYRRHIQFKIDSLKEYHSYIEENFQKEMDEINLRFEKFKFYAAVGILYSLHIQSLLHNRAAVVCTLCFLS